MSNIRWNEIAQTLRDLMASRELPPGTRLPSEKVLAAQWGVCRMTAHRAMSELEREGLVVRKRRVGTIVRETNVLADAAPAHTISESGSNDATFPTLPLGTKRVALLGYHFADFPQCDYIAGLRSVLPGDYHLLLCDTRDQTEIEARYLEQLAGIADVFCLYATGCETSTPLLRALVEAGTPVICFDRVPAGLEGVVDSVVTDNHGATGDALRVLQQKGHERIALLTTSVGTVSSRRERYHAWRDALAQADLSPDDTTALLRQFPPGLGYDFKMLCQCVHDALYTLRHALPTPPTAVLCLDDFFLSAAMEACDRMGLNVPEDFVLLGWSDYPLLAARLGEQTYRIGQHPKEAGAQVAALVQDRLSGSAIEPACTVRVAATLRVPGEQTGTRIGTAQTVLGIERKNYNTK